MTECKTNDSEGSCGTSKPQNDECCTFAEDVLCLAECAKHELLKEKMKKVFEARIGKKLDKVAEVAVTALLAKFEQKLAQKEACHQYSENLMAAIKG